MSIAPKFATSLALAALALGGFAGIAPDPLPENCRLISGADTPDDKSDDLEVCQVRTFFECPADGLPVTNGTVTDWTETEPGSFTEANGCGTVEPGVLINDNRWDVHFAGTFTGRLDSFNIHLNASDLPYDGLLGGWMVGVTVRVDGRELFTRAQTEVFGTPVEGTEERIKEYVIGIANIGETGFSDDGEHNVEVIISTWYSDTVAAMYMGAAEVDSGIDFNPKFLSSYRPAG